MPDLFVPAEVIIRSVKEQMSIFGIDKFELIPVVTDRGTNLRAAIKNNRYDCAAHILNNTIQFCMADCAEAQLVLNESKRLVKYCKSSNIQSQLSAKLMASNVTRWNSTYTMLRSILRSLDELSEVLANSNQTERIEMIDFEAINELITFLKCFKKATIELECSTQPTMQLVIAWRRKLLKNLRTREKDSPMIVEMKAAACEYIRRNWIITELHYMAQFLCPLFSHMIGFGGLIITDRRTRLLPQNLNDLLFLNSSFNDLQIE